MGNGSYLPSPLYIFHLAFSWGFLLHGLFFSPASSRLPRLLPNLSLGHRRRHLTRLLLSLSLDRLRHRVSARLLFCCRHLTRQLMRCSASCWACAGLPCPLVRASHAGAAGARSPRVRGIEPPPASLPRAGGGAAACGSWTWRRPPRRRRRRPPPHGDNGRVRTRLRRGAARTRRVGTSGAHTPLFVCLRCA